MEASAAAAEPTPGEAAELDMVHYELPLSDIALSQQIYTALEEDNPIRLFDFVFASDEVILRHKIYEQEQAKGRCALDYYYLLHQTEILRRYFAHLEQCSEENDVQTIYAQLLSLATPQVREEYLSSLRNTLLDYSDKPKESSKKEKFLKEIERKISEYRDKYTRGWEDDFYPPAAIAHAPNKVEIERLLAERDVQLQTRFLEFQDSVFRENDKLEDVQKKLDARYGKIEALFISYCRKNDLPIHRVSRHYIAIAGTYQRMPIAGTLTTNQTPILHSAIEKEAWDCVRLLMLLDIPREITDLKGMTANQIFALKLSSKNYPLEEWRRIIQCAEYFCPFSYARKELPNHPFILRVADCLDLYENKKSKRKQSVSSLDKMVEQSERVQRAQPLYEHCLLALQTVLITGKYIDLIPMIETIFESDDDQPFIDPAGLWDKFSILLEDVATPKGKRAFQLIDEWGRPCLFSSENASSLLQIAREARHDQISALEAQRAIEALLSYGTFRPTPGGESPRFEHTAGPHDTGATASAAAQQFSEMKT